MRTRLVRISVVLLTALMLASNLLVPGAVKSAPSVDFQAYPTLEVTQGVQNMQTPESGKMVPLVAGRRTYVLFYATGNIYNTTAILRVTWGDAANETVYLNSLNPKALVLPLTPQRVQGGPGRFVFELPLNRTKGTVMLKGIVNPYQKTPTFESDMTNNASNETNVTFVNTERIKLDMWDVRYKNVFGDRVYQLADYAPVDHRALAVDWLYRAYPSNGIQYWNHAIYMGRWANFNGKLKPLFGSYCEVTNWALYDHGSFAGERYGYGMVAETGGRMRGCADPFFDVTASGPTGPQGNGGSSGDDYAGHELGHLFGRDHAAFCGAGIPKSSYPYPDGSISPVKSDWIDKADAVTGYDISNRSVYNHEWRDIMTYCDARWPSDLSYKRFLERVKVGQAAAVKAPAADTVMDRLMVRGAIDPATNEVELRPSFVLTDTAASTRNQPGPYTFVMRDNAGAELDRYAFTPSGEAAIEQDSAAARPQQADPDTLLFFHELLPYHPATTRIDLVGPNNTPLASISAGINAPTVKMLTANTLTRVPDTQQELLVQWEGADADGDQVHYLLQYSNDDGKSWVQYSDAITETEVSLPQENLMAGRRVWLRVLATDGIHTSVDSNDSPMTVFNHAPTVRIIPPIGEALAAPSSDPDASTALPQTTNAVDQTVTLRAEGYDIDLGSLDQQLTWSSNRAGVLQRGTTLSTSSLGAGQHTITVSADDASGGTATDQIMITIVPTMEELPAVPDRLMVTHHGLELHSALKPATTVVLHNQNLEKVLNWNASVDQPWLSLSASSGATPEQFTLALNSDHGLANGTHTARVTFTTPQLPQQRETRVITLTVGPAATFVPLVAR